MTEQLSTPEQIELENQLALEEAILEANKEHKSISFLVNKKGEVIDHPVDEEGGPRSRQYNYKYVGEYLNEYEKLIIVALNDWHAPQLKNVLEHFRDKININSCVNEYGTTLLHYASGKQRCISDRTESVLDLLIKHGADIYAQDEGNLTPYDYAYLKDYKTNMSIIKKFEEALKKKYFNSREFLNNLVSGKFILDNAENNEEVKLIRELKDKEVKLILSKSVISAEDKEKFKQLKPIVSMDEYNRHNNNIYKYQSLFHEENN